MLTIEHIAEYNEKGYTILENALSNDELNALHQEADILMNHLMSEGLDIIKDLGCIIEPWTCGYLETSSNADYKTNRSVYRELRDSINWEFGSSSELMLNKYSSFASQLLQHDSIYLLNEQFIVKPPRRLGISEFAWHRDSDYYSNKGHRDINTVACWTALDSVGQNNGTVEIKDFQGNSYTVEMKAGGILFMSNKLLHKSQANNSQVFRRAFMVQYSVKPILEMNQCIGLAIQCNK